MYADVGPSTPPVRSFRARANTPSPGRRRRSILLVEHDKQTREMVRELLEREGHSVAIARNGLHAEQLWPTTSPDVVVIDCTLADGSSLPLISRFKELDPLVRMIVLSGYGSLDDAVEAIKAGADQFLTKPVDPSALSPAIERALDDQRNRRHQQVRDLTAVRSPNLFAGTSSAIRELSNAAHFLASGSGPVLIEGELGTGKKWLARWLHEHSPRAREPFIEVSCADESRLESQLFGYAQGTIEQSTAGATGLLALVQHGTLFLADVNRILLQGRSRLASLLEGNDSHRPHPLRSRTMDLRWIVGTREPITHVGRPGRLGSDLYAQLMGNRLVMPPLRDRIEDIPALAAEILNDLTAATGTRAVELTQGALLALQKHSWPGNLRELRNVLEHAVLTAKTALLTEMDLNLNPQSPRQVCSPTCFHTLKDLQRNYIEQVFRAENGRVDATAKRLGIPRSSLYHKLKQYRIERFGPGHIRQVDSSGWVRALTE